MAGNHLDLLENRARHRVVRGPLAQNLDPLRRLDVEDADVVERGGGKNGRILASADVLGWRVRLHVPVDFLRFDRVAPLFPFPHRQRQFRLEDGGEGVDERHSGVDRPELARRQICDGPHEQSAGGPSFGGQTPLGHPAGRAQPAGARDEIGERVALLEQASVLIPLPPHLAASARVGEGDCHSSLQN